MEGSSSHWKLVTGTQIKKYVTTEKNEAQENAEGPHER